MLQKNFLSAVKNPADQNDFLLQIDSSSASEKIQRLAIYRDSIQESLINSLLNTFSVCDQLIGREAFRGLAKLYLQKTPAVSADLSQYGDLLPHFIANFSAANLVPYLADMARWEWLYWQVLQGPRSVPLNVNLLQQLTEAQQAKIIFKLPYNTYIFSSNFPIIAIWRWHQSGCKDEPNFNWQLETYWHLVLRPQQNVMVFDLSPIQVQLFHTLLTLKTLESFTAEELSLLPEFMQAGWLGGITLET